jgi:PAS domain S-box-containing protein
MNPIESGPSRKRDNSNSPFRIVLLAILVAFLSYFAAQLAGALVLRPQMIWPLWPGCALLVAVLLSVRRKIWPILIAAGLTGFVVYDLQLGLSVRSTVLLIVADTVEVLIAAVGVSYSFDGLPRLSSVKSLAKYSFFAIILAPLASATIATEAFGANYWTRWRIGFFTEALALLTLTPAILSWISMRREWGQKSRAFYGEAATLIAGLSLLGYVILVVPGGSRSPVPLYALLPFLLWSALRFGSMGISTSMIVVSFLSIWGAVHGRGPFTGSEALNNVMSLQLFLFLAATPFMVLAVLVEEQKESERAFRESEARFRLVADTAPVLIWMAGTDKLCTYFNKPWLDFTGRSLELELGNGWAEGVHPEDLRRCVDTYSQAFERREEFSIEYRLRRSDGDYRWVLDIGVPRFNQDRSFIGYIGSCIDVTERKGAEEALRRSETRLRLAVEAGKMYAYEWDVATDIVERSEEYASIPGLSGAPRCDTREQFLSRVHPDDRAAVIASTADRTPEDPTTRMSYRVLRKDGGVIWLEKSGRAFFNPQGKMFRMTGIVADITERKRAEEALRESEERFRLAAQAGKMFAYEWSAATDVIVRSPESSQIVGIDEAEQLTGQQISARVHPDDRERLKAAMGELCPEMPHLQISYRMVHADGSVVWVDRNSRAHFDGQGRILRIVGMVADVTERKLAEHEVVLANDRLRLAMESGKSVGWEWDLKSGRDSWFGDVQTMFGVPAETFIGRAEDFYRYVHPEDRLQVSEAVAEARDSRIPYAAEFRVVRPDGTVRWVAAKGKFHYSPDGEAERMLGMAVDITERRHTETSLHLFRKLIDESNDAIEVVDPQTMRFLDVNEKACRELGYSRDELLSLRVYDIDPALDESSEAKCQSGLNESGFMLFETVHRRKDGSTYPVEINVRHVELDRVYSVNVVRDITERKRVEETLRRKDLELTEAQRMAQVGSWQWDPDRDAVTWSQELYRIAGRDSGLPAVTYAEHSKLYTPESWERLRQAVEEAMRSGASYRLDLEMIRSDGSIRWVTARGEAQLDGNGRVVQLRGTVHDITERKQVEEALATMSRRLMQAQEQERARIARELHDDIGQRLALLAVELEQLHQSTPEVPEVRGRIGELQEQASTIATDIQSLSHELHSSKLEYLGLTAAMRSFCQEFGAQHKVETEFKSHDVPTPLPTDISLCLFRVLQEALYNSAKHSGVRHFSVELWGTRDEIHLGVSDAGIGFDREAAREGRGLGLVSMEERLRLLRGTFSIESQPKCGTTIHARLPLSSGVDSMRAVG